jgi:hypothetical protein
MGESVGFPLQAGPDLKILFILGLFSYIYFGIVLTMLARKTGTANAWLAWLPVGNLLLLCRIGRRPGWWTILLLIPLVNVVVAIVLFAAIAREVGKPGWLGLLILVPLVNVLMPLYLALAGESAEPTGAVYAKRDHETGTAGEDAGAPATGSRTCLTCGASMSPADQFCGDCGASVSPTRPDRAVKMATTCERCGAAIESGIAFCGNCGAQIAQPTDSPSPLVSGTHGGMLTSVTTPSAPACGHCGTPISPGDRFCGECGQSVPEKPGTDEVSQPVRAHEVPSELIPSALSPRKKKTVLIAGVAVVAALAIGIGVFQKAMKKQGDRQSSESQSGKVERGREGKKPAEMPSGAQEGSKSRTPSGSSPAVVSITPPPSATSPVSSVPALPPSPEPPPAAPPVAPSASLSPPVAKDPVIEEALRDAIGSYERGQYDIAIEKLERILRKDAENQKAKEYIRLAREQKQKAYEQFKRNFQESPYFGGRKK